MQVVTVEIGEIETSLLKFKEDLARGDNPSVCRVGKFIPVGTTLSGEDLTIGVSEIEGKPGIAVSGVPKRLTRPRLK